MHRQRHAKAHVAPAPHPPRPAPPPSLPPSSPFLSFSKWQVYRRALPGLNATSVGLIVTSVFQLTLTAYDDSPFPTTSICIGMLVYGATEILALPAPLVVIAGGGLGVVGWAADMK